MAKNNRTESNCTETNNVLTDRAENNKDETNRTKTGRSENNRSETKNTESNVAQTFDCRLGLQPRGGNPQSSKHGKTVNFFASMDQQHVLDILSLFSSSDINQ